MYGMVNRALEEMVCSGHGEAVWEQIKEKAGVDVDVFLSNEAYPDSLTYELVGAASAVLQAPAEQLLEAFGVHWVTKTAAEGYGHLMKAGGANLKDFLLYLPNFHTRVSLIFPHLNPPRFLCSDVTDNGLHLHYFSERRGLAPFVRGLIQGMSQYFETPVEVKQVSNWDEAGAHDTFEIRWV